MALFTAIATALLAGTFLAGSAIAIGVLAIGLGVAAEVGLSYALKAISGNKNQPAAATDHFGVQAALASGGDVPRHFPLGRGLTGGQLVYANYWGGTTIDSSGAVTGTPNAYLTQVIKVADLPGPRLLEVWINGEKCTLDLALGEAENSGYGIGLAVLEYRKDGADHIWIKYYDGTQTTADPFLVNVVGSFDRPYGSTRIGTGCAYVIATSLVEDTLFTGFPSFKFGLSGIPLYDPSRDDTVGGSGSHRFSDPSTWGGDGDDFPAVQIYNILHGIRFNGAWVYGLQKLTGARLPVENWIAQIAKCREPIMGEDGFEPTYRSGMQINVMAQPANAITTFLTACQGRISEIGGFYKIHLGAPDSPTFAFTDDDILTSEPQIFRPFFALADSVNGIQGRYPDPSQGWNYVTAPAYLRTDLEARDGNRRLMASPTFDAVPYPGQVQRLQKSAIEEGQRARTHTLVLWAMFWFVEPGDVGAWTSARNGYDGKQFRVDGGIDKGNLDVSLSLTEVDPADFDWNHETDFEPVTSGTTGIFRPAAQGILDWFAEGTSIFDEQNIARRPAIRLAWDGTVPGVAGVTFQVRLAADHSIVTTGNTDQLTVGAIIISQSLLPNTAYQARGQFLPSWPRDMLWSDWLDVTTPDVRISIEEFDAALRRQVTDVMDFQAEKLAELDQRVSTLVSKLAAQGWTDIKSVRSQLFATAGSALAEINEIRTVAVDAQSAVADLETTVSAQFGTVNATITEQSTGIATLDGYAAGSWSVKIDAGHNAVGLKLVNDSEEVNEFRVTTDTFRVAFPGNPGVPVWTLANVDGVAKEALRGDMLVDGSILVRHLAAGSVTAVALEANSVTAGAIDSDSIETRHLSIDSIPLEAIIDGATSNIDATSGSLGPGLGASTLCSKSVAIKKGKALIIANVTHAGNVSLITASIKVDGVTVKTQNIQGIVRDVDIAAGLVEWSNSVPITFLTLVTGLSDAAHTFSLGVSATVNGVTGELFVFNPRK